MRLSAYCPGFVCTGGDARIARQMSSDSVSSINSLSSACSMTSQQSAHTDSEANKRLAKQSKKKGWVSHRQSIAQMLAILTPRNDINNGD